MIELKETGQPLHAQVVGKKLAPDAIIDVPCDIWNPAARPDVIHADNVRARLKTRLMPQGANIPGSPEARSRCARLGVLVIPDFIANAGGVICASIELRGGTERAAFDYIDERIRSNTRLVLEESRRTGEVPRVAAIALAQKRVTRLPRPDAGRSSFHSRSETATRA